LLHLLFRTCQLQTDLDQLFEPGDRIGLKVPQELRDGMDGSPPFTLGSVRFVSQIKETLQRDTKFESKSMSRFDPRHVHATLDRPRV
jgi:hypothetical protein